MWAATPGAARQRAVPGKIFWFLPSCRPILLGSSVTLLVMSSALLLPPLLNSSTGNISGLPTWTEDQWLPRNPLLPPAPHWTTEVPSLVDSASPRFSASSVYRQPSRLHRMYQTSQSKKSYFKRFKGMYVHSLASFPLENPD